MAKKLYVGNLPFKETSESLKAMFAQCGEVASANIIIDRMSGRSKGFGFVEFNNDGDAAKAIEMFNGKDNEGRPMTVNEAKPMAPRESRGGGDFRGGNRF
jgi:RNA recognition motif-containing protein